MIEKIKYIESEIIDQYLYDEDKKRPWVIGFSGGKDSTMMLQVVWNALKSIAPELRQRQIYVICNDTLVENPHIITYIDRVLKAIQKAANEKAMPIIVEKTLPRLEDTFWVKLIGKGYPAPNSIFRWCTERLKISPTSKFVIDKVNENGEVIILIGTRSDESATRSKSIKRHEIRGKRLSKHSLPNAYIYTPIKDISNTEVWQFLMLNQSPWDVSNKELLTLYNSANSGDCPLVVDISMPSCGNSRFGCWVCTVVAKDKSMDGLIDSGEDWMLPLSEIRNFLFTSRDNAEVRERKRRDGSEKEGQLGPYKFEIRVKILKMLLQAQSDIQKYGKEISLISTRELIAIQHIWLRDGYFDPLITKIYNKIFNVRLKMTKHEEKMRKEEELLKRACKKNKEDYDLIQELLKLQKTRMLMIKKRGLQSDLEDRIEQHLTSKKKD